MLLQNRVMDVNIPHTSKCFIRTTGLINDGDVVSITSAIFSSTEFRYGVIQLTETFDVVIRINNKEKSIFIEENSEYPALLVCDDNDIMNMYVRVN